MLMFDDAFTLPWLTTGHDPIGKCHPNSKPDAAAKTVGTRVSHH
jgi:hypothetical protein